MASDLQFSTKPADRLKNALALAQLATAAYDDAPANTASFQKTPLTTCKTFSGGETQGFVAANTEHLVVAFRGTEPAQIKDWLTDLRFKMKREGGANVHEGFAEALDDVWVKVKILVSELRDNGQAIWITGHSLGGALATLAAKRLPASLLPFGVYTFGQPRVGDAKFAKTYKFDHFRYVNNNDIVPTVPSRFIPAAFPPAFYTHVNRLQFFNKNGKLVEGGTTELGLLPLLQVGLGPLAASEQAAGQLILGGIKDHSMKNYIDCIQRNLG